jgi:hypothetical protein
MSRQSALHFYPKRIVWIGLIVLVLASLFALPYLWALRTEDPFALSSFKKAKTRLTAPIAFDLGLCDTLPGLAIPELHEEMTFSFDPPRPNQPLSGKHLSVYLTASQISKRCILPCRVDLQFVENQLVFAEGESLFWIELSNDHANQIHVKTLITTLEGQTIEAGSFYAPVKEMPIHNAQSLRENSPFRELADARWWGRDLFKGAQACSERLEIGSAEILELNRSDWLLFQGGLWEKTSVPDPHLPIAHIQSISPNTLIFEGWDDAGHTRVALNLAVGPSFKSRAESLLSSIRIRSEKQISCMIEKQCMVLKTGDWVLKADPRWKVIRKKEEQNAFLDGKLYGELFILDQILQKQGQKVIQGRLFNSARTQMIPIEIAAKSVRAPKDMRNKVGRPL